MDIDKARLLVDDSTTHCGMGCGMCKARGDALIEALDEIDRIHQAVIDYDHEELRKKIEIQIGKAHE